MNLLKMVLMSRSGAAIRLDPGFLTEFLKKMRMMDTSVGYVLALNGCQYWMVDNTGLVFEDLNQGVYLFWI